MNHAISRIIMRLGPLALTVMLSAPLHAGDDTFCNAARSVSVAWSQRYIGGFEDNYNYTITATNSSSAAVELFVSIYNDDGGRAAIEELRLSSGQTSTRRGTFIGPNKGHASRMKYNACYSNVSHDQCYQWCTYP